MIVMEEKQINLQIDHHFVTVPEGTTILEAAQKKIRAADGDLDKLIGTRTNVMKRRLSAVEALDEESSGKVLGIEE